METIAVLASGTGSILSALVDAGLPISVVVVDRPCGAEQIAGRAGLPVERVIRESFGASFDRDAFTGQLTAALAGHPVSIVAMAGFGTVLGQGIHDAYPMRVVNTHPALLPQFKGWHAVADALAAGVSETGCTVHIATLAVDEGPILAQQAVPVLHSDTEESLHERIKTVERRLYPQVLGEMLARLESERAGEARLAQ